jgi:transcriptional regulator with XRE-family HTH domain
VKCDEMPGDPTRRIAREIRAARAYADLSRAQLAVAVDLGAETIGRYERGHWTRPPRSIVLRAIAEKTNIPAAYLAAGFLAPEDPASRFADATSREAQQQSGRPDTGSAGQPDEGGAGAGS